MIQHHVRGLIAAGIAKVSSSGGRGGSRKIIRSQRTRRLARLPEGKPSNVTSISFDLPESREELLATVSTATFAIAFFNVFSRYLLEK
jgi:hypothetical protein